MKIYERITEPEEDNQPKYHWSFYCPGCESPHTINDTWAFDGNFESPTFAPSILVTYGKPECDDWTPPAYRCHSFVRNGRIEYLSDCTHSMAATTVDLPDYPEKWK